MPYEKYVIFLLLMLPSGSRRNKKALLSFCSINIQADGYTTVGISADMLKMVYSSGEESDPEMTKLINDIKGISIVVTERNE